MDEHIFNFYDPRSYIHIVGEKTYLIRPRLVPDDNWKVRNWLVLEIDRQPYDPKSLQSTANTIVKNLNPKYLTQPFQPDNPLRGFCYITSQSLFYLMDTDKLDSWSGVDEDDVTHWWLVDRDNQEIVDVTGEQYSILGYDPSYKNGRKRTWYGFRPFIQKRTMDLIHQIQPESSFQVVDKLNDL